MDVFSRRFQYRIGSGLYDEQLQLHDYDAVERFLQQRRGEISSVKANEHVTRELVLRHQVRVAVTQSLGGRGAGSLPDGPRLALADLYEQVANPLAGVIRRPSLDWLMPPTTPDASHVIQPPDGERSLGPVCDVVVRAADGLCRDALRGARRQCEDRVRPRSQFARPMAALHGCW